MPRRRSLRAVDALALVPLLALFAAVHAAWSDPWGADLQPTPDAMEYVGAAQAWLRTGTPGLLLSDGVLYPSRYAVGYPAALALWMAVTGGGQTSALALNLVLGFAVTALTYLVGRHFVGRAAAFVAAVLVTLSPEIINQTEIVVTEPLATVLVLLITGLTVAWAGGGRGIAALGIGALSGYLCFIRLTHVITLVYVLAAALALRPRDWKRGVAWGAAGFLPFVVVIAVANALLNGSPLRQGYDLWAKYATTIGVGWNWHYALLPGALPWEGAGTWRLHPHWQTYGPMLLGFVPRDYLTIMYYPWPVVAGIVWLLAGERRRLRRRWAWTVIAGVLVTGIVWSLYYFWASRFFMPLMPLVIILGCGGITPRRRGQWSARNLVRGGLLALALWQQWTATEFYLEALRPWNLSERNALHALDEQIPQNALVVFDGFAILADDALAPRRVMNWAVHGRDLLLSESRTYHVPPLRPGDGRVPALFSNGSLDPRALAEVRAAWSEGQEVWVALYAPDVDAGRLRTLQASGVGALEPETVPGATIYRLWRWKPSP